MAFQGPIPKDVLHLDTPVLQMAADKNRPMASQGISLSAQQSQSQATVKATQDPLQAGLECGQQGNTLIGRLEAVLGSCFIASGPKRLAKKDVADAVAWELRFQFRSVELRETPTERHRAHVRHGIDPVLRQKAHQLGEGLVGVAHRVETHGQQAVLR